MQDARAQERKRAAHCVLLQRALQRAQVGRVDHGRGDAHLGQHGLDELARAAVAVGGGHDVPARRHQREQHRRRAAHAARAHLRGGARDPRRRPGPQAQGSAR
jgi:hypothetical protein